MVGLQGTLPSTGLSACKFSVIRNTTNSTKAFNVKSQLLTTTAYTAVHHLAQSGLVFYLPGLLSGPTIHPALPCLRISVPAVLSC